MLKLVKLEDRIVLDADGLVAAAEHVVEQAIESGAEISSSVLDALSALEPVAPVNDVLSQLDNTTVFDFEALDAEPVVPEDGGLRITLVSDALDDYGYLATVASLNSNVIVYDAANETAEQVISRVQEEARKAGQSISHLAIMSHGDGGRINLGSDTLTAANLDMHGTALSGLSGWLAADASIAVYSCNVIDGSGEGTALVDGLADVTGATVYASDDITGRGGDWRLEYGSHGAVVVDQITPPVIQAAMARYAGNLAGPTASQPALWLKADAGVEEGADDSAEDGDVVTRWLDQSGNDNHISAVAGVNYQTSGANSTPTVTFNSGYFSSVELDAPDGGVYTVFSVQKAAATSTTGPVYGFGDGAANTQNLLYWGSHANQGLGLNTFSGDIHGTADADGFISDWGIAGAEYHDSDYDAFQLELNGQEQAEADVGAAGGVDRSLDNSFTLGALNSSSTALLWSGQISEVLVYSGSLSDAEKVLINNYLAAKYGIDLDANDQFSADSLAQGDHDHEVSGIGQDGNGDSVTSATSDIVSLADPSGLANNEYLMIGHDGGGNDSWSKTDTPEGYLRIARGWAVDSDDVGTVDLTIDVSGLPASGTGSYVLLVDADADGDYSDATAHALSGAGDTRTLSDFTLPDGARFTIATVNADPSVVNNTGVSLDEGDSVDITAAHLSVSDFEEGSDELTFTLTAIPSHGELRRDGVALGLSGTFTQEDIDSGLITYVHNGDEDDADLFRFTVSDGNGGTLGETTFDLSVNGINDIPILVTNTGLTVDEGASATISTLKLDVSDADQADADITYTVTDIPDNGQLIRDGAVLDADDTFTQADIEAGLISYSHNGGETTSDLFRFTVSDGAGGSIVETAFNITVNALNDAPDLTVPGAQSAEEGESKAIGGISVSDADVPVDGELEITLSAGDGALSLGSVAGLSFSTGDGDSDDTMVFSGSVDDINTALSSLSYRSDADFSGVDQISVTVSDEPNPGGGGGAAEDSDVINVSVDAVADLNTPSDQQVNEDASLDIAGISLSDVVADSVTVSLSVGRGSLSLGDLDGLIFSEGDGVADGSIVFSGSVADVNSALAGLSYVTNANNDLDDTLQISVDDGLGWQDAAQVGIDVVAINDAPILSVGDALEGDQDETLSVEGLSVTDIDASSVMVTLSVAEGTLTLGVLDGLSFSQGDGSQDPSMSFSGSVDKVNAALAALSYRGNEGYAGSDVLAISVSDQGGSGAGGALSDSDSISITLEDTTPDWMDASTNTGVVLNRGTSVVLDPDALSTGHGYLAAEAVFYQLTEPPANGALLRDGVAIGIGGLFTQADINNGLITYQHQGESLTSDLIEFQVTDGEHQTAEQSFVFQINSVPEVAINTGLLMDAGEVSVLSVAHLSVSDADAQNNEIFYSLSQIPRHGLLQLNGTALDIGDSFTQQDLNEGRVRLVSTFSGPTGAVVGDSFWFTVADSRGGYLSDTVFSIRMTQQALATAGSDANVGDSIPESGTGTGEGVPVDPSTAGAFESLFANRSEASVDSDLSGVDSRSPAALRDANDNVSNAVDVTGDIALLLRPQDTGDFFTSVVDEQGRNDLPAQSLEDLVTNLGEEESDGSRLANAEAEEQRLGFAEFGLFGRPQDQQVSELVDENGLTRFQLPDALFAPDVEKPEDEAPYFELFAQALNQELNKEDQADPERSDFESDGEATKS